MRAVDGFAQRCYISPHHGEWQNYSLAVLGQPGQRMVLNLGPQAVVDRDLGSLSKVGNVFIGAAVTLTKSKKPQII